MSMHDSMDVCGYDDTTTNSQHTSCSYVDCTNITPIVLVMPLCVLLLRMMAFITVLDGGSAAGEDSAGCCRHLIDAALLLAPPLPPLVVGTCRSQNP
jgi:hypothetical protein